RQPADTLLDPSVEVAVVDRAGFPAHPANESDRLHARKSATFSRGSGVLVTHGSQTSHWLSRSTLCWAAWARGLITNSSTLTWAGRLATHRIASATSAATNGSGTPAYTASAA